MIHNRDELKECRQKAKADMETAACRILVCSGTGCIATGSEKIYNRFLKLANILPHRLQSRQTHAGTAE